MGNKYVSDRCTQELTLMLYRLNLLSSLDSYLLYKNLTRKKHVAR